MRGRSTTLRCASPTEHPCSYNRIVPVHYFEREEISVYSLGPFDTREAILLFNTDTELTEDKTVEYFI